MALTDGPMIGLLYGLKTDNLDFARAEVELALDFTLEPHDSSFIGDYFCCDLPSGHRVNVRRNLDPMHDREHDPPEERFSDPRHAEYLSLVDVDGPLVALADFAVHAALMKISGIVLLETQVVR